MSDMIDLTKQIFEELDELHAKVRELRIKLGLEKDPDVKGIRCPFCTEEIPFDRMTAHACGGLARARAEQETKGKK